MTGKEKTQEDLTVWTDIIEEKISSTSGVQLEDIQNALAHITEEKDKGLYGCCNYYMAYYLLKNGRQDECLGFLNEAIRCLIGTDRERTVSRCYNLLGIVAHGQRNLLMAAEQYDKAMSYAEKYNDSFIRLSIVCNLADVYYRVGSYEKAFACYREGMRAYEESGDDSALGRYNYMLIFAGYGFCLTMAGRTEEAVAVARRLYDMQQGEYAEYFPKLSAYTFFALLCHKMGRKEQAEECLEAAIADVAGRKSAAADVDSFLNLIELLILMKRYTRLERVLDYVEPLAAAENNEGFLLQMLAYRLEYCGRAMSDKEYEENTGIFFRIKSRYEKREYAQLLNMMELGKRLNRIEEEQRQLEKRNNILQYQADHDELSGLHNRGSLNRYAEDVFDRALREQKNLGVLFVDIDYFKQMNDAYGHGKGDDCIRAVAESIGECTPGDFAARYGGDEFVVISLGLEEAEIKRRAERIVEHVRSRRIENKNSAVADILTVTVGAVCDIPEKQNRMWDFLAAADEALYCQKKEQKGGVKFWGRPVTAE